MKTLDLNVDLAEGFPYDQALLQLVSSANIACGLHAGGAVEMANAVRWAKQYAVRIGAHPSYPDRENFGRIPVDLPMSELESHLLYQLGALQAICQQQNAEISYVKPHGALYNQAANNPLLAETIIQVIKQFNPKLKLMGLSGCLMLQLAEQAGLQTIAEVFADRRYLADGSLAPRSQANAVIEQDADVIAQILQMLEGKVTALDGTLIPLKVESLCLHGDNQQALQFAQQIKTKLTQLQIRISG